MTESQVTGRRPRATTRRLAAAFTMMAVAIISEPAQATTYRSYAAQYCNPQQYEATEAFSPNDAGQMDTWVAGTDQVVEIWCPLLEDPSLDLSASGAAASVSGSCNGNVQFGYNGNDSVQLIACRTYYLGAGGTCGAVTAVNSAGVFAEKAISDLSAWTGGGAEDTYFIAVNMMGQTSSHSLNTVWSYATTD